ELTSFNFDISQQVNAGTGRVTLQPFSTTQQIVLGSVGTLGGIFGLTDAELDHVTAGVLQIGNSSNTGGILINNAITRHAGYNTLSLITGKPASVVVGQTAPLSVANLVQDCGGGAQLSNLGNVVDALAGTVTTSAGDFQYADANGFNITTVDSIGGISVASGKVVVLGAGGAVTQDAASTDAISAGSLLLLRAGALTLTTTTNDRATPAGTFTPHARDTAS